MQNMFLCYRAKEDHLPSWENLLLLFFLHILNKLYLVFEIPLFTKIEQSKAQCFSVTFSSSSVWTSCEKARMLAALGKIQDLSSIMQTSNWLQPEAAMWMACVQSVRSGQLVLWEVISSGPIF